MNIEHIHGMTSAAMQLVAFGLAFIAVAAILIFLKVFKGDFSQD